MKRNSTFMKVLFVLLVVIPTLACGAAAIGATATPAPTNTPASTNTPMPPAATKTSLPPPTETEAPATPTPAPVGVPVDFGDFQFTVIKVVKLDRVYPGGDWLYTPNAGYKMLDVGIHIKNTSGSALSIPWNNVYVLEQSGDVWMGSWGSYKESTKEIDPLTLGIPGKDLVGEDLITVESDAYLRVIYIIKDNSAAWFGIGDSPLVEAVIK